MENKKNGNFHIKKGRPKGMKRNIVASTQVKLEQKELDQILYLRKKWNMKTKSTILRKCLEKVYKLENV